MAVKNIIICASLLFVETVFSQCLGRGLTSPVGVGWPYDAPFDGYYGGGIGPGIAGPFNAGLAGPLGAGWPYDGLAPFEGFGYAGAWPASVCGGFAPAASNGGGLAVTSVSPIAPTGLTVTSENAIEGALTVVGSLPFLGAVATDGVFPTAGAGAVSYGCGDGAIGITAEAPFASIAAPALGYGAEVTPFGLGPLAGYKGFSPLGGCGCGAIF